MTRRRSPLSRFERDAYLASRTAGDLHTAEQGPAALAGRVARRQIRRRLYAAGAPVVPLPRRRRATTPTGAAAPAVGVLGGLAVLVALGLTIAAVVAGIAGAGWGWLFFAVLLLLGCCLVAGRGGRDGLRR